VVSGGDQLVLCYKNIPLQSVQLLRISDAAGKEIYRSTIAFTQIDMSTWSTGVYNLQVVLDSKMITQKIIKN
jgi:hypothetical protein